MIRTLLIADDHEVVRSGVASLLKGSDVRIVGQAATGEEAVRLALEQRPDVVLLDIRMGDSDGLEALDTIHKKLPDTRVVILSMFDNPTYIARAVTLGASDYLLKGSSGEDLVSAIQAAAGGRTRQSEVLRRVARKMEKSKPDDVEEVVLTQRETQVLRHIALGLSNKEIGRSLTISVETVKEHVQNVLRKIQVTDRTQAAVWALRKGLV